MLGPMEIIMRVATRLGYAIDGMDTEAQLDAMIAKAEQHGDVGADRLTADPTSLRRTPFAAHIPFRQQAMAQMSWRDLRRILRNAPRMKRQTSRGEMFYNKTFSPARRTLSPRERADLVAFMKSRGADEVGFLPNVDPRLVFAEKALPERHAIVFTVGMDRDAMATAPSNRAFTEVMSGYADLG